ncbi:D-alanyl-D-alanine carboxypeptidase family protein [Metabacillus halosaccharovorans]|uniref:D-alanyl-D-alanine carboxypeptidase n=1 Tax=Metabacillus halosaccharovorans TaxID=930124 RepID=A0ABT3DIS2_9BACI|nr:D-alanyl-D-alanine carboxypeptidase family protein [Metabacillus halosaccharovorans]MCV9886801.1 D-alanyl-D-alanine carboxypeptidase [Metabacillus halosaccharovorans]
MKKFYLKYVLIAFVICSFILPKTMEVDAAANIENKNLQIYSEAVVLIDADSGEVLYEKNSKEKLPPASITKIATAIYAIEKGNINDLVTVSENARNVDGTRVYLEAGEQVPLKKLIQGLVINSGNDAGVAIAEHLSGSVEQFTEDFNEFLQQEVGVENTHFSNPHGLHEPDHLTTAEDMAKITQYAIQNQTFRDIFQTSELKWDGESWDTTLINHHEMVRDKEYEGIAGGKNGFVQEAGFTLVTTAERKNISLIAVTLNSMYSQQSYDDTITLLDYGFEHFETDLVLKNEKFTDGFDHSFLVTEETSFTKRKGETIEKEVSPSGELIVKGEDQRIIKEVELDQVENKVKNEQMKSEIVTNEEVVNDKKEDLHLSIIVPTAVIIGLFISLLFYFQVRKI